MPTDTARLIDCHVHLAGTANIDRLDTIRRHTGADAMNIVCVFGRENVNSNYAAFAAKSAYPERFYVFGGLDHSQQFSSGEIETPSLAEQVDRLIEVGADGVKLLETKPDRRKLLDIPIDSDYFEGLFARAEETGFPLLWHVADPEEFWEPDLTPKWAKDQGWGYDDTFVSKEQLYSEVTRVLERHPRLKVIFAHFFFLSADLPRASALLDRFANVSLDLAPGIELLYNLSRDVERSREFLLKYADRILFGTDVAGTLTMDEAAFRSNGLRQWLASGGEYRVAEDPDELLGPPGDGILRGLSLPGDVLSFVLAGNFERIVGPEPRTLDRDLAARESERIAGEIELLGGDTIPAEEALRLLLR